MPIHTRRTTLLIGSLALASLASPLALAQDNFPNRPIRLVVPYAAGGGTDILARQLSTKVSELLGQPIVVDNRPGAGTTIGATEVARAAPDGYTLLWGDNATYALNPHVYKKLAYDPVTSFTPISLTVRGSLVLLAADRVGVKSVNDLIAMAKSQPGKLSYGTPGNGTPHHLAMEALKLRAGNLQIQHIPYRGEAPAVQDLIGGTLHVMFAGARVAKPQTESGRAHALAVSGGKRNPTMPQVPTVSEAGLTGYSSEYWHGVVAPAKTPADVVTRINTAFVKAMASPEMVGWINNAGSGAEWTGSSPTEMQAHIQQEIKNAGELVKAIGLSMD